ncbi:MMPL family transporter [Aurantivibrio infirmus]
MSVLRHRNKFSLHYLIVMLNRWPVAVGWLAIVIASLVWIVLTFVNGRHFDTSVLALLPEENNSSIERLAKQRLTDLASRQLIFLVSSEDRTESLNAAEKFSAALTRSKLFSEVNGKIDQQQTKLLQQTFFPYRYNLLDQKSKAILISDDANYNQLVQQALARLYSPMASVVSQSLLDDPLQLHFQWQLESVPNTAFGLENNWLTREFEQRVYRMIRVELKENPYDLTYQQQVLMTVASAKVGMASSTQVLESGLLFHAAYGADQAKREISTIGIGSLAGITLLLLYCFHRVRFLIAAFLPIFIGCTFSLAACLMLFENLHLITLAFGAGLVGVAIDYSLHYLCADREFLLNNARNPDGLNPVKLSTLYKIMPGISLGLVSSVLAYAAQGISPFPGLRQMATFSVLGLFGAWLTVVCWMPRLRFRKQASVSIARLGFSKVLQYLLSRWPTIASRTTGIFLVLLTVVAAFFVSQVTFDDSVRRLQTSPDAMLEEDIQVQTLTAALNPGQYFIVSAPSIDDLLLKEELLHSELNALVGRGDISGYQAISRQVPSIAQQQQNRQLVERGIYANEALLDSFGEALGSKDLAREMREKFAETPNEVITVNRWLESPAGELMGHLWLGEDNQQFHSVILFSGIRNTAVLTQLSELAQLDSAFLFVDNVASISSVLSHYRIQLQKWIVFAYLLVIFVLVWRYRRQVWRVVAAPAIASLCTLAILSLAGISLNIFNLLALLLILGIGLDASIFLRESGRDIYTWVAVTLAAITTLLAFGLLALSVTPVLHQFGITVFLGIVAVWLLAPCFVVKRVQ